VCRVSVLKVSVCRMTVYRVIVRGLWVFIGYKFVKGMGGYSGCL